MSFEQCFDEGEFLRHLAKNEWDSRQYNVPTIATGAMANYIDEASVGWVLAPTRSVPSLKSSFTIKIPFQAA